MDKRLCELKLKVLYDISNLIGQALNLDQTLELILGTISDNLQMKRATITLKDQEKDQLAIRASHGMSEDERKKGVYGLNEGVTGRIFQTAAPFVAPDVSREPLFLNRTGARDIRKSRITYIGAPIVIQGKVMGVLSVDRLFDDDTPFEEDIEFLTILGALFAQLISLNMQVRARESRLVQANLSLKADLSSKSKSFFGATKSPAMLRVQQLIKKVAPTNATVLLLGESGAGKTLVAEIIHELSSRSRGPFVKVNSAALPKNLLESELFGYEKGAFTGAEAPKAGRVEEANGGAIFLDEIGELPPQLQAKLLRFLQDHEFERLGGAKTRKVDVRIIAATNADLAKAVQNGRFREDLYYRLNVFPMAIPPLRERKADLEGLIEFFVNKVCARYGCDLQFTREALQTLIHYPWPGNVREMENLVERLAIIWGTSKIGLNQLAPYLGENVANYPGDRKNSTSQGRSGSLMDMERERIIEALERNNWVQSRAAKELGITLRQIGYRIKKYGLEESLRQRRIHI